MTAEVVQCEAAHLLPDSCSDIQDYQLWETSLLFQAENNHNQPTRGSIWRGEEEQTGSRFSSRGAQAYNSLRLVVSTSL